MSDQFVRYMQSISTTLEYFHSRVVPPLTVTDPENVIQATLTVTPRGSIKVHSDMGVHYQDQLFTFSGEYLLPFGELDPLDPSSAYRLTELYQSSVTGKNKEPGLKLQRAVTEKVTAFVQHQITLNAAWYHECRAKWVTVAIEQVEKEINEKNRKLNQLEAEISHLYEFVMEGQAYLDDMPKVQPALTEAADAE